MSTSQPIPLTAVRTLPDQPAYRAILGWQFAEEPFYEGQVKSLLQSDIPQRILFGACAFWVYQDPDGNSVGFGTLDVCKDYACYTDEKSHTYIPLLAVNPAFQKRGHGRSIVQYLIAEAVLCAQSPATISDILFLDVYTANKPAISLYEKCGFVILNPDSPIQDPQENNESYIVMATKAAVAQP
jgi:ribosomal protein S18 acetylase RimI-like enzyme